MRRRHWFYWILFLGGLGLVVGVWIHRNTDESIPGGDERGAEQTGSQKGTHTSVANSASGVAKTARGHVHIHEQGVDGHGNPVVVPPEIPAEKLERINALYDRLSRTKARAKAIEVLTEGMDALSAAKYLKTLHGFYGDLSDAIREYAERALAENPDSFDALFIKSQLSSDDAEREAGFRRLYEMNPHSYDTVYELGSILVIRNSEEAVEYFQQAVAMRPREADAYLGLANSYHKFGYLEESLAAYQKAHQLHPDSFSQMGIDHVENDIEWARAQGNQEAVPEETAPE
jgi:predicted DNA-binding protein